MDKAPASLIDANSSTLQPPYGATDGLNQYVLRPGHSYLSGAHVLSVAPHPYGVPYTIMGLDMQTCNNMYITAPEPPTKSVIFHDAVQPVSAGQYAVGAAPTSGIYTGVEDVCS